ncbi:nuclear transport factor 2 family protein [Paenibacillus tarimensis]
MQELFHKFCQSILEKNMDDFFELFDDEAVFEYPYAPNGYTERMEGKEAIVRHLKDFPQQVDITQFGEPSFYFTLDPSVMIVEFEVTDGRMLSTGKPYLQKYISVIKTKNSKIIHYKDYWNPLVALAAMQGEMQQQAF